MMIKIAMLAATAAVVVWFGWPGEELPAVHDIPGGVPGSTVNTGSTGGATPATTAVGDDLNVNAAEKAVAAAKRSSGTGRLDINHATVDQFERLPAIGPVLAQRIIEQRKAHGPFRSVEDLRRVKGIGEKRMERLRPLLVTSGSAESSRRTETQEPRRGL